jgi:(4S)-4-hydroxy-5-phosphonooxypentane-2,3-dione isomerase
MSILISLALPAIANTTKIQSESKGMSKIALIVEFHIKAGQRDAFLEIIRDHASGTKRDEKGCLQFDVLIPEDDNNTVLLVEMYRNDAARAIHAASPRMKITRAAYRDIVESRNIVKTRVVDGL